MGKIAASSWLNPRHWALALGLMVLWAAARLPLAWSQRIGRSLGILAYYLLPSRRSIVLRNLELCFPEWTALKRAEIVRANFISTGMGLVEGGIAWWGSAERVRSFTQIQGVEYFHSALQQGRGVLVLGAHLTSMELGGRIAAMTLPASAVFKAAKDIQFNAVMLERRGVYFKSLIANDNLRGMLELLKSGSACWYGVDQDFGAEQSVFAPFFNVQTATLTLASKIAQRTGAVVLFSYSERLPCAKGYVMHFCPVKDFPSGDLVKDATRYNSMIEEVVHKSPADYFWLHRRFKTRPQGDTNPYD